MRTFQNLKIDHKNNKTRRYADFISSDSDELDETAREMLGELKQFLIPMKIDDRSIFQYNLEFDPTSGVNPSLPKHKKYLEDMGRAFQSNITDQIIDGLRNMSQVSVQDNLYREVVQHANFGFNKAQLYCGREKILNKLFKRFSAKMNTQPLILFGESGVGKTATVAKLIQETWKSVEGTPNVVYRFLGTTPGSSSIDLLFLSLSMQVCELYGLRQPSRSEEDFNLLRPYFFDLLEQVGRIGEAKQLIIILDSLGEILYICVCNFAT